MAEMNEEVFGNFVMWNHKTTNFELLRVEASMGLASEAGEVAQVVRKEMFESKN